MRYVPVVDKNQNPLMPTNQWRSAKWIKSGKATPFWKRGVFCVRLNIEPSDNKKQQMAIGIDPGSKREAFTIKTTAHTHLNVLTETIDWVKDAVERRKNVRKARRHRNCRRREARFNNRKGGKLSPSTKARWQWKLNIIKWLKKMFPITDIVVEDIKAKSKKGCKKWNQSFSPLEHGKNWFYNECEKLGTLHTFLGYETKSFRDELGLKKSLSKLADKFECHNVDSWVLANKIVGGHTKPDNIEILKLMPLQFHRRQLHVFQSRKGGKRKLYGGTRSMGLKRGSLVKHKKYGLCYVGGTSNNRISVHDINNGKTLSRDIRVEDCKFLTYNSFRVANNVI